MQIAPDAVVSIHYTLTDDTGNKLDSSDGTPFYLRPYVALRGVQALQYQGEQAAEIEAELRWQFGARYSVVGFAGTGEARLSAGARERSENVSAGGAGFRYLIARRYGMQMGVDVAGSADDTVVYVVFGNAWVGAWASRPSGERVRAG